MQEYYNSISQQKRIAFVDNLSDSQARELSNNYPYAICFASNVSTDYPDPVIWYNGRRYGYTKVDSSPITISGITISLNCNEYGVLSLSTNSTFDDFQLISIQQYNPNRSETFGDQIEASNGSYSIYTLFNKVLLRFRLLKGTTEVSNNPSGIIFDNNNVSVSSNNAGYILTINKYLDHISTNLSPKMSINGSYTSHDLNCNLTKVPDTCNWYVNGDNVVSSISISRNEQYSIKFNFDGLGTYDSSKFGLYLMVNGNRKSINPQPNVEYNNILNTSSDTNNLKLVMYVPNNTSIKKELNQLSINFGETPINYIVNFYDNIDNSRPYATIQGPIGTPINRPQPTRTGFTRLGWNTNPNATTTINIPDTIQATMPFNNYNTINYYAIWQEQVTYYWYVGGTQPTSINESTWKKSTTDAPFTTTATATPGSDGYVWCAFPSNWNYDITDSAGFGVAFGFLPASIKNSISGYILYRIAWESQDTWTFKFTK